MRILFLATAFALAVISAHPQTTNLGPNVLVLSPSTPHDQAQAAIDRIYAAQQHNEFGSARSAILLLPGDYHLDIPIGFYTQLLGLGASPNDTHITGNVHVDASLAHNNATCTFWRGAENLAITPHSSGTSGEVEGAMQWAVSQAVPLRRMHVLGDLTLHQHGGWASGGWLADSLIDGTVAAGPQQQWISRNSDWRAWTGSNWNMVFVGVPHAPADSWPKPAFTTIERTPIIREKPFLTVDAHNHWAVFLPALKSSTSGPTWTTSPTHCCPTTHNTLHPKKCHHTPNDPPRSVRTSATDSAAASLYATGWRESNAGLLVDTANVWVGLSVTTENPGLSASSTPPLRRTNDPRCP